MKIKIKYHTKTMTEITKIKEGDWIDLRAAETVTIQPFDFKLISLGISVELPEGYEAHIAPRSSTYKNFRIIQTNSIGIIDNSYSGDNDIWKFPALNVSDKPTTIYFNDRICQFRIVKKQPEVEFEKVDKLNNQDRGGIGSTGVK